MSESLQSSAINVQWTSALVHELTKQGARKGFREMFEQDLKGKVRSQPGPMAGDGDPRVSKTNMVPPCPRGANSQVWRTTIDQMLTRYK